MVLDLMMFYEYKSTRIPRTRNGTSEEVIHNPCQFFIGEISGESRPAQGSGPSPPGLRMTPLIRSIRHSYKGRGAGRLNRLFLR